MITGSFPIEQFQHLDTPLYYYDMTVLHDTLLALQAETMMPNWHVHYAIKACATEPVLQRIAQQGIGADCVSAGEVQAAIVAGLPAQQIVFAGVAKTDKEIRYALEQGIFCFNVESIEE